jgi:Putative zinc-finger
MKLARQRGADCVSDLVFDRWHAGELPAEEAARVIDHLATCTRCADRQATLTNSRDAFAAETFDWLRAPTAESAPTKPAVEQAPMVAALPSRRVRWLPGAAAVLALAAGVLLLTKVRKADEIDSNERLKGVARFAYYVQHDGIVREGLEGEKLSPGDAIQLSYSVAQTGHLAIFSVDGARRASTYWPRGERAAPIGLGRDVSLPESIVLDETLGPETVYTLFCIDPVTLEPIRSAIERSPEREPQVEGCTMDRVRFVKVAR